MRRHDCQLHADGHGVFYFSRRVGRKKRNENLSMSEETTTTTTDAPAPEDAPPTENQPATTPAGAQTTDTPPADHMIPKARFDEVNTALKELQAAQAKADTARTEAERKAAEEQGEFKKLYEAAQAEIAAKAAEVDGLRVAGIRQSVAAELGVPTQFVERLQGSTLEEITADAKTIMAAIPKPAAPNINSGNGTGAAPVAGELTPEAKRELAAKFGVNEKYL